MGFSRREFALAAGAATALGPSLLRAAPMAQGPGDAALLALFADIFQEDLVNNPESATYLGVDVGRNADLRGKLHDTSERGREADAALNASQLRRLEALDRSRLSPARQADLDTLLYSRRSRAAVFAFPFGGWAFGASPYVVSQLTGAYQSTPQFLETKHPIRTQADIEAWLARLDGFSDQLDGDTARMSHDAGLGVIPPDYILDLALSQMNALGEPAASPVVSLARRAAAAGLSPNHVEEARAIWTGKALPALARQLAATTALRARAGHDAGVWRFRDGEAYYRVVLQAATTTRMTPEEVHQLGLDQGRTISSFLEARLAERGLTQGTVGERIGALLRNPDSFFPNDDAGKTAAIAYCNSRLSAIRPKLPSYFHRLPPYQFEVRRVPPSIEAGAALAYSEPPSLDGSRPGVVYFNLHDTHDWPKFDLPTTVFHEGLPGHQLEGGLLLANHSLPILRKTIGFSGYTEGWALYAEQLADEIGMYENDPLGRIGFLRAQLFRCGRCIVDTGIHARRWSRERAIAYFQALEADPPGAATREVERYTSVPGQACAYKIGHTVWEDARARARKALGARFDIKDFHDVCFSCGRVPLEVLDRVVNDWITSKTA
ncbi:MAG: DUF885 domain-containing protein [Caulobacteraceae bacterium]